MDCNYDRERKILCCWSLLAARSDRGLIELLKTNGFRSLVKSHDDVLRYAISDLRAKLTNFLMEISSVRIIHTPVAIVSGKFY